MLTFFIFFNTETTTKKIKLVSKTRKIIYNECYFIDTLYSSNYKTYKSIKLKIFRKILIRRVQS